MSIPNFTFTCSKSFKDYPCCHRQWKHSGHCKFVHGYSRSFTFWFAATNLDENGFVVDFSSLREVEGKLKNHFDHTFLINEDDPLILDWQRLHKEGALDLRIMKNVGMESSAELIWNWANSLLFKKDSGRTCCWRTESRENDSNAACFELVPDWFKDR
ncbi:6-carboxytetrahydropterin synthase [Prochlorococcus sp. MIT 1223]|uniref:6-carboxytetrahydropterin synthase n=1 Tax=Prochlorococcus sp. MIT 1223 TaxID=3096217 RepID=UPI002A757ACA|nr:6-carboxytetrahydropterin synthase [Prochlorococcus sp. MIT 1223]